MHLISIIVPIHNLEKFLAKCIESVINQTYKELEIILVNDGSKDSSLDICRHYQVLDNRIVVIDKECGGVSDARNAGIAAARGEYIFPLDGDDYILKNTIELLYNAIVDNKADMAVCNYLVETDSYRFETDTCNDSPEWQVLDKQLALEKLVSGKPYYELPWNKLYRRCLFDTVSYPVGKINEDEFVAHEIYGQIHKAVCTRSRLYAYVQHKKSIMATYSLKRHDKAEAYRQRFLYLRDNGYSKKLQHSAVFRYLIEEYNFNYNIRKEDIDSQEKKLVKAYYDDATRVYHNYFWKLNPKEHVKIFMIRYCPAFYRYVRSKNV